MGKGSPGTWGLEKRVGAVSLTAPIKVMTQRHRIPVSMPSPPPLPPPCKHGFAKRCPELCGTPTMAGMGSGTPKEICVPLPCPPHPSQNLTPSPQDLVLQPRGPGLPPVIFPQPNPYRPPWTWGVWTFGPCPLGGSDLWALASGPCRDLGSDTPIPAQASEVLVVGGEAHHPRLW